MWATFFSAEFHRRKNLLRPKTTSGGWGCGGVLRVITPGFESYHPPQPLHPNPEKPFSPVKVTGESDPLTLGEKHPGFLKLFNFFSFLFFFVFAFLFFEKFDFQRMFFPPEHVGHFSLKIHRRKRPSSSSKQPQGVAEP